jgi:hypothetical protein
MTEEVKKFVSKSVGIDQSKIKLSDRVEASFGLGGLDTVSFFEEFFIEFNIINPQDFNIELHAADEGMANIFLVIKAVFSKNIRRKLKKHDVTIEHLIKVAELKNWIEFKS